MIHYVTYATHSYGMYEKLINNKYNIDIKVLGWNTKWYGFMDKYKAMIKYCDTLSDEHIVVFLDGFDTIINKNTKSLEAVFDNMQCDILLSKHNIVMPNYITHKVFGTCQNNVVANSGMYMGKCKYVKRMLRSVLNEDTDDDQRALNSVCSSTDLNIVIDTKSVVFHNGKITKNINPYFISYPGAINAPFNQKVRRYYRAIFEYSKYFKLEITIFLFLCIYFLKKYYFFHS